MSSRIQKKVPVVSTRSMTSEDLLNLTAEMKSLGVVFFEFKGCKVVFEDKVDSGNSAPLFSDQKTLIDQLTRDNTNEIDSEGKSAVTGALSDEDLFGSSN